MKAITRLEMLQAIENIINDDLILDFKETKEPHKQVAVTISKTLLAAMMGVQLFNIPEVQKKYLNFGDEESKTYTNILSAIAEKDIKDFTQKFLEKISSKLTAAIKAFHTFSGSMPPQEYLVQFCEIMCNPQLICRTDIPKLIFEPTINLENFIPYIAIHFLNMELKALNFQIICDQVQLDKESADQIAALEALFCNPPIEQKPIYILALATKKFTTPPPTAYTVKLLSRHTHALFSKEIFDFYKSLSSETKSASSGIRESVWSSMSDTITLGTIASKISSHFDNILERTQFSKDELKSISPKDSHLSMSEYLTSASHPQYLKEYSLKLQAALKAISELQEVAVFGNGILLTEKGYLLINFLNRVFPVNTYQKAIEQSRIPILSKDDIINVKNFLETAAPSGASIAAQSSSASTSTPPKQPPPLPPGRIPRGSIISTTTSSLVSTPIVPVTDSMPKSTSFPVTPATPKSNPPPPAFPRPPRINFISTRSRRNRTQLCRPGISICIPNFAFWINTSYTNLIRNTTKTKRV